MSTILELKTTIDDWTQWAFAHDIPVPLVAFLRYRPELLSAFKATADLTNSPVPRAWSLLAQHEALGHDPEVETAAFAGAVGEAAANEYIVFRRLFKSMGNLDAIIADPDHAPIPTGLDQLYAVSIGLAGKANDVNFGRIATYAHRLATEANKGEFAVLLVRDAVRKDASIQYTQGYTQLTAGPIGKLFTGQN
jgi:hypothetical protein